ncbi:hypothetical protein P7C70_g505, partial [Phenoliferia sp. Uapishka_3]
MRSILFPLTDIDASGVDMIPLTTGSLFTTPVDVQAVEDALSRVTTKWKLLAGRMEWDHAVRSLFPKIIIFRSECSRCISTLQASRWTIRIPLDSTPPSYHRYTFTSTTSLLPAPFAIPDLMPGSAQIIPMPPISHFRDSSTPSTVAGLAKSKAPLISVKVSTFVDCQVIGVTVPHGVFDAIGLGLILKAIDAELSGREWSIPEVTEKNTLASRIESLSLDQSGNSPLEALEMERRRLGTGSSKSYWDFGRLVFSLVKEKVWHGCEIKEIFIGNEVFAKIVKEVKEEVQRETGGREWVSTADILVAWTQKVIYGAEITSTNQLLTTTVWDIRSLLSTTPSSSESIPGNPHSTSLLSYPHNALSLLLLPSIPVSSLHSTSLFTLALQSRRFLSSHRTLPSLSESLTWASSTHPVPARRSGTDSLNISNQVLAGLTGMTWGGEEAERGWWIWAGEGVMDHCISWNKVHDGWVGVGSMRRERWEAVERELERMVEEKGGEGDGEK